MSLESVFTLLKMGQSEVPDLYKQHNSKFSDAGIQDISTSISIEVTIDYLDDLTERYDDEDDESDNHLGARDR